MAISNLNNKINQARTLLLNNTFQDPEEGGESQLTGTEALRYFREDDLAQEYRNDLDFIQALESLARINSTIRVMRSSYLPIDFYPKNPNLDSPGAKDQPTRLTGEFQDLESYENTLMRMLGMPLSSQVNVASVNPNAQVDSNEFVLADAAGLLIYDIDKEKAIKVSYDLTENAERTEKSVREHILNERQRKKEERKVPLGNQVYVTTYANVVVESTDQELEEGDLTKILISLENLDGGDFIKSSYLLVPPIQDDQISSCINEPKKIVPLPFDNPSRQKINSIKTVPSLLETVIKIRLDKGTGSMKFQNPVTNGEEEEVAETDADSYGLVEALFIIRLRAALQGLADKIVDDVDDLITTFEETQLVDDPEKSDDIASVQNTAGNASEVSGVETPDELIKRKELLESKRLVEDAIISLLNENLKIPELLSANSKSMYNSQLVSSLLDIIDVPRQNIIQEIKEIERKQKRDFELKGKTHESIDVSLGLDIGVGVAHIIIFALALFTIPEDSLLGLLSEKQFENLKTNSNYKNLIEPSRTKKSTLESVNELSRYLIDGFQLFETFVAQDAKSSALLASGTLIAGDPTEQAAGEFVA